jgi:hypothetical protein
MTSDACAHLQPVVNTLESEFRQRSTKGSSRARRRSRQHRSMAERLQGAAATVSLGTLQLNRAIVRQANPRLYPGPPSWDAVAQNKRGIGRGHRSEVRAGQPAGCMHLRPFLLTGSSEDSEVQVAWPGGQQARTRRTTSRLQSAAETSPPRRSTKAKVRQTDPRLMSTQLGCCCTKQPRDRAETPEMRAGQPAGCIAPGAVPPH